MSVSDEAPVPRVHRRVDWHAPVLLVTAQGSIRAETRNVSVGGMLVATSAPIAFGEVIRIAFRLPALQIDTETDAIVRWKQPYAIGLQFVALRAIDVWALHRLLR